MTSDSSCETEVGQAGSLGQEAEEEQGEQVKAVRQ